MMAPCVTPVLLPTMQFSSVVFPAPEGPIKATISVASMEQLTWVNLGEIKSTVQLAEAQVC